MIRTRVGYAGGTKKNPTYHSLGDYSETIQMDFDPKQITYGQLLDVFWESHSPESRPFSRQYMSVIFYHDDGQKTMAQQSKDKLQQTRQKKIYTELMPGTSFYPAESYHQKYYLRGTDELMKEFEAMYPRDKDFIDSTAAARVNGYIAGYGSLLQLEKELGILGLSTAGNKILMELVKERSAEMAVV